MASLTPFGANAKPPTAIFCVTDMVAFGAVNALAEMGVLVPDDVSVVGFDDLPLASWPVFDLSTIRVDFTGVRPEDLRLYAIYVTPAG